MCLSYLQNTYTPPTNKIATIAVITTHESVISDHNEVTPIAYIVVVVPVVVVVVDHALLADNVRADGVVVSEAASAIRTNIVLRSQYPGAVSGALSNAAATVCAVTP